MIANFQDGVCPGRGASDRSFTRSLLSLDRHHLSHSIQTGLYSANIQTGITVNTLTKRDQLLERGGVWLRAFLGWDLGTE